MKKPLLSVAIVAMLVLAGCIGVTAPTQSGADREHVYPPGVSADGVENASVVVDAHNESVWTDGAVRQSNTVLNGTTNGRSIRVESNSTVRLAPNATRFRWTVYGTNTLDNETTVLDERYYANRTTFVTRVERDGEVTVRSRNRSQGLTRIIRYAATQTRIVNATLSNANYTVADTAWRNGRAVTTLAAENGTYSGDRELAQYDATVEVAAGGRVLSIERSWVSETEQSTTRYHGEITWRPAEPIEPPAWLPRNASDSD